MEHFSKKIGLVQQEGFYLLSMKLMTIKFRNICWLLAILSIGILATSNCHAEEKKELIKKPKTGLEFFDKGIFNYKNSSNPEFFANEFKGKEVIDLTNADKKEISKESNQNEVVVSDDTEENKDVVASVKENLNNKFNAVFDSDSPEKKIVPPDQDPKIAINKDASGPAIAMVAAYQDGDKETASKYASQWVRYQQNFFFLVRDITQLVGDALIKQGEIDEEQWVGVNQYIDYEFAKTRQETGSLFKPKHEHAMQRIKADSKGEAEIYYFFTLNCSWCRKMAPDVERLWKSVQADPKIKMVALTIGPAPKSWIEEYRKYTGLTIPILNGENVAKKMGVKFVPAVVITAPNSKNAYLKTGEQTFERLYEFTRTVQGLPASLTPEIKQIISAPVGEVENLKRGNINKSASGIVIQTNLKESIIENSKSDTKF